MRTPLRLLFVLVMSVLLALVSTAPPATADGGSEGTVKIHEGSVEPTPLTQDEPKVCAFHVHGLSFDSGQSLDWWIDQQGSSGDANVIPTQHATALPDGSWVTDLIDTLPNGQYKLYWQIVPTGTEKHKVFKVECAPPTTGTVRVFKYNDLDGNGSWATGEPGRVGWTFDVLSGSTVVGSITTGADGNGSLVLAAGAYRVNEHLPLASGWTNTQPGGATPGYDVTVVAGQDTAISNFGNHYTAPPTTGTLSVTKYNDLDNDGKRDENEGVLSGWMFTAKDAAGATVGTMTTDATGTGTLGDLVPGTYSLVETTKPGWTNTDPGGGTKNGLAVTAGQTSTATFGNHQTLALLLTSMCSVDPQATREWRVRNSNPFDVPFTWEVYGTSQTGSGTALANADVFFTTVAVSGPNTTKIYWNGGETVKASGGATCAPTTGTLRLLKYNDLDNDGSRDLPNGTAGEPGLSGWSFTVQLLIEGTPSGEPQTITTGTDPLGEVTLTLAPGQYRVCEVLPLPTGWSYTDPDSDTPCENVNIDANEVTTISFGNHYTAPPQNGTLRVFKYNDLDNNGQQGGAGESGLSQWSFTVTPVFEVASLQLQSWDLVTGGDVLGFSEYLSLAPGTYRVCENTPLPADWTNTDPGDGYCKTVGLEAGASVTVNFGNHYTYTPPTPPTPQGTLNITKYNDRDLDGARDPGEPGLSGWTFEIRSGGFTFTTITTGSDGTAALTLGAGTYTVAEVPQLGWTSVDPGGTAPSKTVTVALGQATSVIFGNAQVVILPPTSQTQIIVFKYADGNANGKRDDGEGGLAGLTFLIRDASGATVATAETNDLGFATITNLPLGGYTVVEQPRTGWTNTDPGGTAQKFIVLTGTGTIADVSFGNAQVRLPSTSTAAGDGGTLWVLLLIVGLGLAIPIARRATPHN